jgi:membrane protease YdiL (CAAX protease family)
VKAIVFVGLTVAASWLMVGLYLACGGTWTLPGSMALSIIYMFVPMTVAIIVQKLLFKSSVRELGISLRPNRWFLAAWLLPPAVAVVAIPVSLFVPGASFTTDPMALLERFQGVFTQAQIEQMQAQTQSLPVHPFWLGLLQGLIAGITVNAVAAFGEELGWRGLLQKELAWLGFWRSSLLIGLIWGIWHAPIILQGHNYPQHPWAGVGMMTVFCILLSPVMSYITLRANSVIAAAVFHGTLNGTSGLALMVVHGGDDLTVGVTGLAGLIVLAVVNLGLLLVTRTASS